VSRINQPPLHEFSSISINFKLIKSLLAVRCWTPGAFSLPSHLFQQEEYDAPIKEWISFDCCSNLAWHDFSISLQSASETASRYQSKVNPNIRTTARRQRRN
jgi:hypothetical protein